MLTVIDLATTVLALFTGRGVDAKARGGALAGALLMIEPLIKQLQAGLIAGSGTSFYDLGFAIAQLVVGTVVGYAITWLTAANADREKEELKAKVAALESTLG